MNFARFVQRRARGDRFLAVGVLVAVFLAAIVVAGGPIYLRSLERVGMADVVERLGQNNSNVSAISDWIPLEASEIEAADSVVDDAVDDYLAPLITGSSTRVKSREHFWGVNCSNDHFSQLNVARLLIEEADEESVAEAVGNYQGVESALFEEGCVTIRSGDLASRAYFQEIGGLVDHVTILEGRAPRTDISTDELDITTLEVLAYKNRTEQLRHGDIFLDLSVGDEIVARSISRSSGLVRAKIVGIFTENDPNDRFWLGSARSILEPNPPTLFGGQDLPIVLFTAEDGIAPGVGPSNSGLPMQYTRVLFTDLDAVATAKSQPLLASLDYFDERVTRGITRGAMLSGLRASINGMAQRTLFLRLPAFLLAALAVSVVAYYLFLVSGLIARRREIETVMLRSRGLSAFQVIRVQLFESIATVIVPAVIAPFIAAIGIGVAGRLPVFSSLTDGGNLPVELTISVWFWSLGAAIVAFLIVLGPTLLVAKSGISNVERSRARPDNPPIFQRIYLDILIVVLGGLFLWELSSRGVASSDREGQVTSDPTLLFAPVMLLISVALLTLRAFPVLTRVSASVATRFTSASVAVGFWRLGRSPYWYAWPVLLIILGTGLGVMVGTVASTLERSNEEQIFYDNGTNLRIIPRGIHTDVGDAELDILAQIDGVNVVTKAFRNNGKFGTTDSGPEFELLGVESDLFPEMAWFRDDFADEGIDELFGKIGIPAKADPLILPEGTTQLAAWTKQDPYVSDHFFWIVLEDRIGRQVTVTLGQIGESWAEQVGNVPQHLDAPIEIVSIQTFMQAGGDGGAPTTWFVDDLKAIGPGFEQVLLDFDTPALWVALPTSNGLDDFYTAGNEEPGVGAPGTGIGVTTLERGTIAGVRGLYRSPNGEPIPAIVSENFLSTTGAQIGAPIVVKIFGGFVPVKPVASVKYFPTLDPESDQFMVLDVDALLGFVDLRGLVDISANEIFADIDPARHEHVAVEARNIFRSGTLLDRQGRVNSSVIDPLTVAGWRGMGIVALLIGGAALVLGYVTYLVAHSNRTIHDSAYLRAMGLRNQGFVRSSLIEHGIVALVGVVVGVAAGIVASRIAVSAMAYTERGDSLLPPFVLQTTWWPVGVILLTAVVAGLFGIVSTLIAFLRTPLHELTRSAE